MQVLYVLEELGADLEIATFDGATPAYIAAFHGHIEVLQALYDLATDVDHPMPDGATPTFIAAANGQVEVLRTLYELEADMNRSTMDGKRGECICRIPIHVAHLHRRFNRGNAGIHRGAGG